jgi:5-(carboxyamino)imidazole ribonucleotide synthase
VSGAVLPGSVGPDGQPAMLGVMGGGQLARMFVHAAQAMGFRTAVLDPDADSPAGRIAHLHLQADYQDTAALQELARCCAAVTTEFENVPARSLAALAEQRPVAPGAEAVAICQQRGEEKAHFMRCGVPCAPHTLIDTEADLADVDDALFPGILKTALLGYDGKGQSRVAGPGDLTAAWQSLGQVRCVLEKRLELQREISVIVARAADGQMVHLPVQHNLHRDGILAVTEVTEVTLAGSRPPASTTNPTSTAAAGPLLATVKLPIFSATSAARVTLCTCRSRSEVGPAVKAAGGCESRSRKTYTVALCLRSPLVGFGR